MASIVTTAEAQAALPNLTAAQVADLPFVLDAATTAIEGYCDRSFAPAAFDEVYHPGRSGVVRLKNRPVLSVSRVSSNCAAAATITYASTLASRATAELVTSGDWPLLSISGITLRATVSGVAAAPQTLAFATYPTVATLAAAVNAIPPWNMVVAASGLADYATADLSVEPGAKSALFGATLWCYAGDVSDYELDVETGIITVGGAWPYGGPAATWLPDTMRAWDRTWGVSPRYGGVRVAYATGYATMPADVKRACILTAQWMLDATRFSGHFRSESDPIYKYELGEQRGLPAAVRSLLTKYVKVGV